MPGLKFDANALMRTDSTLFWNGQIITAPSKQADQVKDKASEVVKK